MRSCCLGLRGRQGRRGACRDPALSRALPRAARQCRSDSPRAGLDQCLGARPARATWAVVLACLLRTTNVCVVISSTSALSELRPLATARRDSAAARRSGRRCRRGRPAAVHSVRRRQRTSPGSRSAESSLCCHSASSTTASSNAAASLKSSRSPRCRTYEPSRRLMSGPLGSLGLAESPRLAGGPDG
jgi:hypothetical protein